MYVRIAVLSAEFHYHPECGGNCPDRSQCSLMALEKRLMGGAGLMRLSVVIENDGQNALFLSADGWEMVDTAGFAAGGAGICEALLPADSVAVEQWEISAHTCVRTQLAFPVGMHPPAEIAYCDGANRFRAVMLRREALPKSVGLKIKKRGRIRITGCWSWKENNQRKYIFTGIKK